MKKLSSLVLVLCMVLSMSVSVFAEGTAVSVSTADELVAALEAGNDVIFANDIEVAATTGGYNLAGIVVSGQTVDGAGHTLTVTGANSTWDCAIYTNGGTIKNLTVSGAFRGIFTAGASEDIIIDNVVIDNVCYTFNSDGGSKDYSVIISNSTLNGWTSYSDVHKQVSFINCKFGKGTGGYQYAFCRPYNSTDFTNCDFSEDFEVDVTPMADPSDVAFTDCIVGGEPLTQESLTALLGDDAANATVSYTPPKAPVVEEPIIIEKEEEYKSIIASTENGSVSVDDKKVTRGEKVTITVTPNKGYELAALSVMDEEGNERKLTENEDGTFSFRMPEGGVTIEAEFAKIGAVETAPSTEKENPSTGASDFVGAAAALAMVSVMGMAALSIKR